MTEEALSYIVAGMSCDHCKDAVGSEVAKVEGVAAVEVDLETKRVLVRGSGLSDEAVRAAIDEAGYEATPA